MTELGLTASGRSRIAALLLAEPAVVSKWAGSLCGVSHIKDLVPDPQNRRAHNPRNIGMVVDALHQVGAARSIVIDEDNVILAGNGVTAAAAEAGITKVRVIEAAGDELIAVRRSGLTAEQKRALAMYDNRTGELATWDTAQLAADLKDGVDLAPYFFVDELKTLFASHEGVRAGLTDPDVVPTERPTGIVAGDLFGWASIGFSAATRRNGRRGAAVGRRDAFLMVTDPPYGVAYDPAWRAEAGVNRNTKKLGPVANDDRADWTEAWRWFPGDVAYVWHAGLKASLVEASLVASGFDLRSQIIWAKDRLALSRGDYHWQHEPCWYAVRSGQPGHRTDDRSQTTLWTLPAREDSGHGHGTQKPVACMRRPIQNHEVAEVRPVLRIGHDGHRLSNSDVAVSLSRSHSPCAGRHRSLGSVHGLTVVKVGEAVSA